MSRSVFVSGCFDLLHSGHIAFLQAAAAHGDLHVGVGSDATVRALKGRNPICSQDERLFMVRALGCVKEAFISGGSGMLDFAQELRSLRPEVFVVNEDGNVPQKRRLCQELGIRYLVLPRYPHGTLPARSSSALRKTEHMPYRIDLAGGWLDQPFVSSLYPGPVVTISIEPTVSFNERSGMATSTRNHALELWGPRLPSGDGEKLARTLFCYDNPPGTVDVSGAQDSIGIVLPGLNRSCFEGAYWPTSIDKVRDENILQFVENSLYLVRLDPRADDFHPLEDQRPSREGAHRLAQAADACWQAILHRDLKEFGTQLRASFEAQIDMFPHMVNDQVLELLSRYQSLALGWKLSGAGGGGYLIFVSQRVIPNAIRVRIRREME